MNNLCIIPARGGSKRIPRKNIKEFCGKPIITYSIEIAINSGLFSEVMVSTDDNEIAEVARQYGASVPFMRPANFADDYTGTVAVIAQVINQFEQVGKKFDAVCCIYATAPFIRLTDLSKGLEFINKGWAFAFPATEFASSVYRSFKQTDSGGLEMLYPEHFSTRSQDLGEVLFDAGQFYWGSVNQWKNNEAIFGAKSFPIKIPRRLVHDIDTAEDWLIAEMVYLALQNHGH